MPPSPFYNAGDIHIAMFILQLFNTKYPHNTTVKGIRKAGRLGGKATVLSRLTEALLWKPNILGADTNCEPTFLLL